jgi:excisionase family DNA binding protein
VDAVDTKSFLTIAEVARALRVTPARAYELARNGELPHVRRGRRVLVPAEAWRQWMAKQTEQALAVLEGVAS